MIVEELSSIVYIPQKQYIVMNYINLKDISVMVLKIL